MANFGLSWDSMFFLPQLAFPNDYINDTIAVKPHIPTITVAFWLFLGLAFAAFTTRRKFWHILFLTPVVIYLETHAFAYGLALFGVEIQLDGL